MSPAQRYAESVVAVSQVLRHPYAPALLRETVESQARAVRQWADEMKTRLDAWAACGAKGRAPVERFETWKARRGV